MHPLVADRRRLAATLAAALPLAAATAYWLTRSPGALPPGPALAIALPLSAAAVGLMLPVWYLCRALPPNETPWSRLLFTHGGGAVLSAAAFAYLGSALARLIGSLRPGTRLPELYQAHLPGLAAAGALVYLLAASLHYVLLALDAKLRAEQRAMQLAVVAREAELKALKAQVQPHFLFNSLNSISALVTADAARAREMCILLAEFFRKSLALGEKPSVSLQEELAVAETYLAIEGLRLGSRLRVEQSLDEDARSCRLPPLLLQPLVENAVRHGIATCAAGGLLRIEARASATQLRLGVENPFDPQAPARPGVGLGLESVRRLLHARYGEAALLDVERGPGRFRVSLRMPREAPE